jgi:hypothetical protein
MLRMWWCLRSPWHRWTKVVRVSDVSDKITCSCGREYGMNNCERIILPWHMVKPLYDDLARINGDVGPARQPQETE